MTTLTLVPLDSTYINPAEIAAIRPEGADRCCIILSCSPIAIPLNMSVEGVIERLKSHFEPPFVFPQDVAAAVEVAKALAPYFPKFAPTTLASGVEQLVKSMKAESDEKPLAQAS